MATRSKDNTLTDEFRTETISLRGQTYTFRELTGTQYEECVKLAEGPDGTADLSTVLRLMIPLSLTSPKWDAERLYNKPLPVLTAIQNLVNKMHFRAEVADDEPKTDGDDAEETAKNASEPSTS